MQAAEISASEPPLHHIVGAFGVAEIAHAPQESTMSVNIE
jgi:hypothetical protein